MGIRNQAQEEESVAIPKLAGSYIQLFRRAHLTNVQNIKAIEE